MIKSARISGERFWHKLKFRKERNTFCISNFMNWEVGSKDPPITADDLISGYIRGFCRKKPKFVCIDMITQNRHIFKSKLPYYKKWHKNQPGQLSFCKWLFIGLTEFYKAYRILCHCEEPEWATRQSASPKNLHLQTFYRRTDCHASVRTGSQWHGCTVCGI